MIPKRIAPSGNRTRAARVAGEHSTTEPPMLVDEAVIVPLSVPGDAGAGVRAAELERAYGVVVRVP